MSEKVEPGVVRPFFVVYGLCTMYISAKLLDGT